MTNKEAAATLAIYQEEILNTLWLTNEQKKGLDEALDLAIKALDAMPIESITTQGGMTLSLTKTDIETSDLIRCIADVLKDITVEELANSYNTITFTDNNSGESVSYCRVDGEEADNDTP